MSLSPVSIFGPFFFTSRLRLHSQHTHSRSPNGLPAGCAGAGRPRRLPGGRRGHQAQPPGHPDRPPRPRRHHHRHPRYGPAPQNKPMTIYKVFVDRFVCNELAYLQKYAEHEPVFRMFDTCIPGGGYGAGIQTNTQPQSSTHSPTHTATYSLTQPQPHSAYKKPPLHPNPLTHTHPLA